MEISDDNIIKKTILSLRPFVIIMVIILFFMITIFPWLTGSIYWFYRIFI